MARACHFFVWKGHEMIPKGKRHDRHNEYEQQDQEAESSKSLTESLPYIHRPESRAFPSEEKSRYSTVNGI